MKKEASLKTFYLSIRNNWGQFDETDRVILSPVAMVRVIVPVIMAIVIPDCITIIFVSIVHHVSALYHAMPR